MSLSADLKEFIELLNSRGVDYVVVGAHCLAFHARPRYTGDLDILIRPSTENASRLISALREFGFTDPGLTETDFTAAGQIVQLGRAPNRIDLLTGISGVETDDALATGIPAEIDGLPVRILSKELLIRNKKTVGRAQDIADLAALGEDEPDLL